MFSEKSTELQRRGKRLKRAGKKVVYFKPDIDNRYSENEIVTHDGFKVPAINIPVDSPSRLIAKEFEDVDVFLLDEIQFFSIAVVNVIEVLLEFGKQVIVAGLDLDSNGSPFVVTAGLMAKAEHVVKLHAVCADCGQDSWVTYKENKVQKIEIGTDGYKPLCRKCFNNKTKGGY